MYGLNQFVAGRYKQFPVNKRVLKCHCFNELVDSIETTLKQVDKTELEAYNEPLFTAYLDFREISENKEWWIDNCNARESDANVQKVVELYDMKRSLEGNKNKIKQFRNENSKKMNAKLEDSVRAQYIEEGTKLKQFGQQVDSMFDLIENALQVEAQKLPNKAHPECPRGAEGEEKVVSEIGAKREFDFEPKSHVELGLELGLLEFNKASQVSGSRAYYLKEEAALLELALTQYACQKLRSRGFKLHLCPDIVQKNVLARCGFQPRGAQDGMESMVYSIEDSSACLTGTAEVPLGGLYLDEILTYDQLPIKMGGIGHAFRNEPTQSGVDGGLYRVKQFSKVEMFIISDQQQSEALLKELVDIEVEMFTELGLHFKVLDMPTGDLGAPANRKFDIEAWMPGLNRYGEISSASSCTDYQARRLRIRYRINQDLPVDGKGGKKKKKKAKAPTVYAHTLNATACAIPRMLICILENYQQKDGSVEIPEVLRGYMGGLERIGGGNGA